MTTSSDGESLWALRPAAPWGDYGQILVHGMSRHRVDGRIQLERTGPFIPQLSVPSHSSLVVTAALRERMERDGITGAVFAPLDKVHVVQLDWIDWDRGADLPAQCPSSGEPEDYILARPHCDETAACLGTLSELVPYVQGVAARERVSKSPRRFRFTLEPSTIPSVDIFRAAKVQQVFVTDRLRRIFEAEPDCFCEFHPVILGPLPVPQPPDRVFLKEGDVTPPGYEVTQAAPHPFSGERIRVASRQK